jgi:hypothetical protein
LTYAKAGEQGNPKDFSELKRNQTPTAAAATQSGANNRPMRAFQGIAAGY